MVADIIKRALHMHDLLFLIFKVPHAYLQYWPFICIQSYEGSFLIDTIPHFDEEMETIKQAHTQVDCMGPNGLLW